ncbi:MAG TPA: phenylalanine--tRNA ligase subunit beta [Epsilonproteobacteria bacterium]|nr:phenylalanine--tRNA ligase subunit beta [Campylobacterota bacterium]
MIVVKSWLSEFIDLSGISDEKLYQTFNAIGLEVDSIKTYEIPEKVVVGKILSCEKHPDADKLNVCQVDVGTAKRQIVCGAANVVDAEYVAVAVVGAKLPGDFEIKFATLRGVDSEGMICASSELGLPNTGKGIMILDESIGALKVGQELGSYDKISDTIIELELTANRGDCLSIHGVARDLGVALDRELKHFEYTIENREKLGIARMVDIHTKGTVEADLCYTLSTIDDISVPYLIPLRLGMVGIEPGEDMENYLQYATHATGVILRAYDCKRLKANERLQLQVTSQERGIVTVSMEEKPLSIVGVNQTKESMTKENSRLLLFESSYIHPDLLVEAVAGKNYEKDDFYYKTSRGSEPALTLGMEYLSSLLEKRSIGRYYEGYLHVDSPWEPVNISVNFEEIAALIGQKIEGGKIATILKNLGFGIHSRGGEKIGVVVPRFRHDIKNIQDVAEEIVRIIGINNIDAKPLEIIEANRLNETMSHYVFRKALRQRAAATGLHENISYLFSDRNKLESYGFDTLQRELDLTNPIAEELNTLRSTILVNLLETVKRNVNYTAKSIGLFETGAVFDANREQKEVLSLIFSGHNTVESVVNSGKPEMINFAAFVQKLGAVIGSFELLECSYHNGLIHPYQSADIYCRGVKCGYVSKLHPVVQEDYGIYDTFIAELEMEALYPKHINAEVISKFQGVYKDLSVVIDKETPYHQVKEAIASLELDTLKKWYPVDIYEDETLGAQKSLTIRFFIQSMDKTLQEDDIESVMSQVMEKLEQACQATLR